MNNAMSHDVDFRSRNDRPCLAAPGRAQQTFHGLGARALLDPELAAAAARVLYLSLRVFAVPRDPAFPQASRRVCGKSPADLVKAGLQAAGTRIEHEDFHRSDRDSFSILH